MKKNLYELLEQLFVKNKELFNQAEEIKCDVDKQDELQNIYKYYKQIEEKLKEIDDRVKLTSLGLSEVLSSRFGQHFVLKIFRETTTQNGKMEPTGKFICCYLTPNNPFYFYDVNPNCTLHNCGTITETYIDYLMTETQYKEFICSLDNNTLILLKNDDIEFISNISPAEFIKKINFVSLFTKVKVDGYVNDNFVQAIAPVVAKQLKCVYVDENLNLVSFQNEK